MTEASENARLAALRARDLLDGAPDPVLTDIAEIAAHAVGCPIAVVSLVDKDRIWLKANAGLPGLDSIARDPGLCGTAVQQDDPWVVENAAVDPRTLANPLVAGDFGLRFYAGIPLKGSDGYNIGMLAVIDAAPRTIAPRDLDTLSRLARLAVHVLETRVALRLAGRGGITAAA